MNWDQYPSIRPYFLRLPHEHSSSQTQTLSTAPSRPWEQCTEYPEKPSPIRELQRLRMEFGTPSANTNPNSTKLGKVWVNTYSLWSVVASFLDDTYSLSNPSLQKCHTQHLQVSLRAFVARPTVHRFLTGRRAYPILELLDKPRVEFEKKHQTAIGYFLSFLFDCTILMEDDTYSWSKNCGEAMYPRIRKNKYGFWFVERPPES